MRLLASMMLTATLAVPLAGQTVEYRAPGGRVYNALPDTGPIARAEAAAAARPEDVDRLLALGLAYAGAWQYREAVQTFTRALALAPRRADLYRWRGHRYLSLRVLDSARADLEHGLSLDARCYGCLYHLGIVRFVAGEWDDAARAFRRALPLAPDAGEFAGSVDWLWMSLMRGGHTNAAAAVLAEYGDRITATNAYARRIALYRGMTSPQAILAPDDTAGVDVSTLAYGLGNWFLLRGDTTRARSAFERAVATEGWPAFGFIAAEAELRRLR